MVTDLLADAPYPYIRFSSANRCSLAIGHNMLGTPEASTRNYFSLPLRKGKALEPMVVEWLADHGFSLWFTGDDQLQVFAQDPFRSGHPDGLIGITDPDAVTWWANHNVPKQALDMMYQGKLLLLEIKTMGAEPFSLFKREGLSDKDNLFRNYRAQIQGYLNTLKDPSNDELWFRRKPSEAEPHPPMGSEEFRALLREYGYERPTHALLVAFSPADNEFAFLLIEINETQYRINADRLHREVIVPMRLEGRMPDPSYDGTAAECFFCPYADICPVVIEKRVVREEESFLDSIPLTLGLDEEQINELCAQYKEIGYTIKGLEESQRAIRAQLDAAVIPDKPFATSRYRVKRTTVKGRSGIDMEALNALLTAHDLTLPRKTGAPYTRLYITPIYGDDYDKEAE